MTVLLELDSDSFTSWEDPLVMMGTASEMMSAPMGVAGVEAEDGVVEEQE